MNSRISTIKNSFFLYNSVQQLFCPNLYILLVIYRKNHQILDNYTHNNNKIMLKYRKRMLYTLIKIKKKLRKKFSLFFRSEFIFFYI